MVQYVCNPKTGRVIQADGATARTLSKSPRWGKKLARSPKSSSKKKLKCLSPKRRKPSPKRRGRRKSPRNKRAPRWIGGNGNEEKKDPEPLQYSPYVPFIPPRIQELGDLYFWEWIDRFSKDERLKALKKNIRPKTEEAKGGFRPLTDTWIRIFFDQTTPQERVAFYDKGALPKSLMERYVEEMRRVPIHGPRGNIPIEEANEIVRRAFRNNGYECAICLDSARAEPVNTGCNHGFRPYPHPREWLHASCLRNWTRNHGTCPLCREPCVEPPNQRVPSLLAW